jgi:hypothetical protein
MKQRWLSIVLTFACGAVHAQAFPKAPASQASNARSGSGIDAPVARSVPAAGSAMAAASTPTNSTYIPLSKSSEKLCKEYFEKNKKELAACKEN